jgi:hypothetical protein
VPAHTRKRLSRLGIGLAVAVVGVGAAIAGPGAIDTLFDNGPKPITHVPADDAATGMVYTGLTPAKKGQPCVGSYQVGDRTQCSHGPDAAPAGLSVHTVVKPIAAAVATPQVTQDTAAGPAESTVTAEGGAVASTGSAALVPDAGTGAAAYTVGSSGVACDGDGTTGKRVQVLYVRDATTTSRFAQYLASFRSWSAGVDAIYEASAQETGGDRHVRFVTTADCAVDVQEVEVPAGAMADFNATINALKKLGWNRTDRKYMIFGDSTVYCGIGTFAGDDKAAATNASNGGPGYGRADSGCWAASVSAHELGHNLGAVNNSAPNSSKAGHCLDEYDVMCYNDSGGLLTHVVCNDKAHDNRLDCNHDDYYNTNPSPGSYLSSHWNVADNQFLISGPAGGGTTPTPTPSATPSPTRTTPSPTPSAPTPSPTTASPTPSPTPTSTPSPTASPTASPTMSPAPPPSPTSSPTGGGTGLADLQISATTSTSVRLAWVASKQATRYAVVLNGQSIGTVASTRVRIVGLRPGTAYQIGISTVNADGSLAAYTKTVAVTTPAAAKPTASSRWLTFDNSLTGEVADLFGARSAAGTPAIIYRANGGANQAWKLADAGNGTVLIQSKASNLCLTATDTAGSPLVSHDCATATKWTLTQTAYGTSITSPSGLVVGLGNGKYFGSRLLVLQKADGARYQSWTVQNA